MAAPMNDLTSLDGKRILVTGAAQGLGEAIAGRIVDLGGSVLIGDVQDDAGGSVAEKLGDRASFHHLDVTSEDDWQAAVAAADDRMGGLDGLVNNAAILYLGALETMPVDRARKLLEVNLLGPMIGIKSVTPSLRIAGRGSIVNIASIGALEGMNSTVAYSSSKFGVRGLTRSASLELGRDGVRVNAVCPAMGNPDMHTPFLGQVDFDRYAASAPVPTLIVGGRPRNVDMYDVSEMVVWLLSDASAACSGADFVVDAGHLAGPFCEGLPGF